MEAGEPLLAGDLAVLVLVEEGHDPVVPPAFLERRELGGHDEPVVVFVDGLEAAKERMNFERLRERGSVGESAAKCCK